MSILDKIRDFNWLRFNDIGKEVSKLADAVKGIATDARKLGKGASAEDIAALIVRVKSLKDGTTIDELLGQLLGGAESIFDEHANERAALLEKGQKQSSDLDAPQDTPKPPPPPVFAYLTALPSDPGQRPKPERVWRTEGVTPPWYCVDEGLIGGGGPDAFFPELPNGEQPNWKILRP